LLRVPAPDGNMLTFAEPSPAQVRLLSRATFPRNLTNNSSNCDGTICGIRRVLTGVTVGRRPASQLVAKKVINIRRRFTPEIGFEISNPRGLRLRQFALASRG
jgi:hypothetical protein